LLLKKPPKSRPKHKIKNPPPHKPKSCSNN
jgi:hypothetical protein